MLIQGANTPLWIANQTGSYTVQISDANGCTALSLPVVISVTGINDLVKETFTAGKQNNPNYKLKHAMQDAAKVYNGGSKKEMAGGNKKEMAGGENKKEMVGGNEYEEERTEGGKSKRRTRRHKKSHKKKHRKSSKHH